MNEVLKYRVMNYIYEAYENALDDKHFIQDFIMNGSTFIGLTNMSDKELIGNYESMVGADDELLAEIKADMAIVKMLAE